MSEYFEIQVDGHKVNARAGMSIAVAMLNAGCSFADTRGPWCGMGSCFACRVWIDGHSTRGCTRACVPGLVVVSTPPPAGGVRGQGGAHS